MYPQDTHKIPTYLHTRHQTIYYHTQTYLLSNYNLFTDYLFINLPTNCKPQFMYN